MQIRIQVFLSRNGYCSRRKALELVRAGHVSLNGVSVVEPSVLVDPQKDKIAVDGIAVRAKAFDYIVLNKPKGYVTTSADKFAKKIIYDLLPPKLRHLNPAGRLDKETEGLLLLTNDGDLLHKLTHPRFSVNKKYFVCVKGQMQKKQIDLLERGIFLEGKRTAPARIERVKQRANQSEFFMTIHEGRKRQIRLMLTKVGHPVLRLCRLSQGPLRLGQLKLGAFRKCDLKEIEALRSLK